MEPCTFRKDFLFLQDGILDISSKKKKKRSYVRINGLVPVLNPFYGFLTATFSEFPLLTLLHHLVPFLLCLTCLLFFRWFCQGFLSSVKCGTADIFLYSTTFCLTVFDCYLSLHLGSRFSVLAEGKGNRYPFHPALSFKLYPKEGLKIFLPCNTHLKFQLWYNRWLL